MLRRSMLVFWVALLVPVATAAASVTVTFRCDDWRAFGTGEEFDAREAAVCQRIVGMFRAHGIPLTVGVTPHYEQEWLMTPADSSAAVLRELVDDPLFEVALHGFTHQRIGASSEWLGVPSATQKERLARALAIMAEAVPTADIRTFLPPWNSFDLATVEHLQDHGFDHLSGDTGIVRKSPYKVWSEDERDYHGLAIAPCTTSMVEFPAVLEKARAEAEGAVVVVILHPYNFYPRESATEDLWLKLERALTTAAAAAPGVVCTTVGELDAAPLTADRYTTACRYHVVLSVLEKFLPESVLHRAGLIDAEGGKWLANGRYLVEPSYRGRERRAVGTLTVLALLPALPLTVVAGRLLRRRRGLVAGVVLLLVALGGVGLEGGGQFFTAPTLGGLRAAALIICGVLYAALITTLYRRVN